MHGESGGGGALWESVESFMECADLLRDARPKLDRMRQDARDAALRGDRDTVSRIERDIDAYCGRLDDDVDNLHCLTMMLAEDATVQPLLTDDAWAFLRWGMDDWTRIGPPSAADDTHTPLTMLKPLGLQNKLPLGTVAPDRWKAWWAAMDVVRWKLRAEAKSGIDQDEHESPGQHAVPKPAGWTRKELIEQATHDGAGCSSSTFDTIRRNAGIPGAPRGGAGAQRRYSVAQLRRLIAAAESPKRRQGKAIATAWRELLPKK